MSDICPLSDSNPRPRRDFDLEAKKLPPCRIYVRCGIRTHAPEETSIWKPKNFVRSSRFVSFRFYWVPRENVHGRHSPNIAGADKAWKNMDYTYQIPPDPSYDELSIQPIWYNPGITYNEDTFSPPPEFSSNSLNTIACLCSNFNDETSAVSAGHWYNVHELAL